MSLLTFASGDNRGSDVSARQLVRALTGTGTLEYTVFAPPQEKDAVSGVPVVEVREPRFSRRLPAQVAARVVEKFRTRQVRTQLETVDVLHYTRTSPLPKLDGDVPTVVALHHTQHRDVPDFFGPARRSFQRAEHDRAARSASAVVVATEFVRERAIDALDLDRPRVHVIPPGINHTLYRPGGDVREPFLVYTARAWPHKNHARLFEAFAELRKTRPQLRLVLAGDGLDRLGQLPDGVERWGVVPGAELASLYRRAACLVFPSLYEGFARPPLEAMACGCPVACSKAAALPELVGDAAVLFDPLDPKAIADAILETDDRREELRALGLERAATFTWEEAARRHEEMYRTLA